MEIRNDDAPWGQSLDELKSFCELCDKYKVKIIQAIPIFGECYDIDSSWSNERIMEYATHTVPAEKIDYLRSRNDLISVHGEYHSHYPSKWEIRNAKMILESWGLKPSYYTPPFNEYNGVDTCGLTLSVMNLRNGERLEDYLEGMPLEGKTPPKFTYLHSWRFFRGVYKLSSLEELLDGLQRTN